MNGHPRFNCALDATMSIIEGRWKSTIICLLARNGEMRFNEILNSIGEVSSRMLSKQLKELERDRMVNRKVEQNGAVKVSYSLTERGNSIIPVLQSMALWGIENQFTNIVQIEGAENAREESVPTAQMT